MQQREKILLWACLSLVALWQGQGLVTKLVFEPLALRERQLNQLQETISDRKVEEYAQELAARRLGDWKKRSLPPDPLIASSLYQNWLIELANTSGLAEVSVSPGRVDPKPKGNTYFNIPVTIKARAPIGNLRRFLHDFYGSGLLHRVSRLQVDSSSREGDPILQVALFVEGLALVESPPRTTLFADKKPDGPLLPLKPLEEYADISRVNRFVRGYNGPPPPPVTPRPTPPPVRPTPPAPPRSDGIDLAAHVFLIAALSRDGERDAWLYDRTTNTQSVLKEGAAFRIAGLEGVVLAIGRDFVVLQLAGEARRLELGQNLRQIVAK